MKQLPPVKLPRTLDVAMKDELKVGDPGLCLTHIRSSRSKSLRTLLDIEPNYKFSESDIQSSREFGVYFFVDQSGNLLSTDVEITVSATNCSLLEQSRTIEIYPNEEPDNEFNPVEFMLAPLQEGTLQIIVQIFQTLDNVRRKLVSKPLVFSVKENTWIHSRQRVISLLFETTLSKAPLSTTNIYHVDVETMVGNVGNGDFMNRGQIAMEDIIFGSQLTPKNKEIFTQHWDDLRALLNDAINKGEFRKQQKEPKILASVEQINMQLGESEPDKLIIIKRLEELQERAKSAVEVLVKRGELDIILIQVTSLITTLLTSIKYYF